MEDFTTKRNRRLLEEADKHRIVVGSRPGMGIHKESRKVKDKREKLIVKKFLK